MSEAEYLKGRIASLEEQTNYYRRQILVLSETIGSLREQIQNLEKINNSNKKPD